MCRFLLRHLMCLHVLAGDQVVLRLQRSRCLLAQGPILLCATPALPMSSILASSTLYFVCVTVPAFLLFLVLASTLFSL